VIFVTVGTYKGDDLIRTMDEIHPDLDEEVIAQIGYGEYRPRNLEYFRFMYSLDDYYDKADLVIGMSGVGTIFELLHRNARFVGISNQKIPDRHQNELLEKLSDEGLILWCRELNELRDYILKARTFCFKKYTPPDCKMERIIAEFLTK
jgi:UDP-N-acetylglucosamine transferase subunit ALG13